MKLAKLLSKPQLMPITIDDEKIVAKYGEPLEFYIYDRQDMDTFMKLAMMEDGENFGALNDIVTALIRDENGKQLIDGEETLPTDVMLKVIETTVKHLGNSVTQTLEPSPQS